MNKLALIFLSALFSSLVFGSVGCGGDSNSTDAKPVIEAGQVQSDTGTPGAADATSATPDAGVTLTPDTLPATPDSGTALNPDSLLATPDSGATVNSDSPLATPDAGATAQSPKDAGVDDAERSNDLAGDFPSRDLGNNDSGSTVSDFDAAAADLARDQADRDGPAMGRSDVAAVDGDGGDLGPGCQAILPGLKGDSVDWMASQCGWTSPRDPIAPAAGISLADMGEAMSFRIRVDIDPEAYAHQGYVSAPALAEVGPQSGPGMEVLGPSAGTAPGQYFFDLRWANQVAPREGLEITLTASFSFACTPAMSRTIPATTTAKLVLCRSGSGRIVWRAPGETCDTCEVGSSTPG